jgi:hypothetical protein
MTKAIENYEAIKRLFPVVEFCACGNFSVAVRCGANLCEEHTRQWTEQRLGIAKSVAA